MADTQLKRLTAEISRLNKAKGWRDNGAEGSQDGPWFAAYIALAHSELSEALEAYRDKVWSDTQTGTCNYPSTLAKPIGVGPELADVLIRLLDMCDIWDIDIEYELERVLAYGHTRPHKHGGKTL